MGFSAQTKHSSITHSHFFGSGPSSSSSAVLLTWSATGLLDSWSSCVSYCSGVGPVFVTARG